MELRQALIHAATQFDAKEEARAIKRRLLPNIYALGHMLRRIDEVMGDIERGADTRAAICAAFNGTLLSAMLRAAKLEKPSADEKSGFGRITYSPVTGES